MQWGKHINGKWPVAPLAIGTMLAGLGVAQKAAPHGAPSPPIAQQHMSRPPATPQPQQKRSGPQPQAHVGDWLRRYKDLPPDEVERELKNDPQFKQLPPKQQQVLLRRMQHFASLPPDQQLQMLNRMETWEHLTREQKQQALQVFGQMRQLPPDRRRLVHKTIDDLRAMPPDQREQKIDSGQFKGMFSDQERELMRGATRLPLAPPDSGDQPGQAQE